MTTMTDETTSMTIVIDPIYDSKDTRYDVDGVVTTKTAILIVARNGIFVLTIGSNIGETWTLTEKISADSVLVANGYHRTSAWQWTSGFLTCDIEPQESPVRMLDQPG